MINKIFPSSYLTWVLLWINAIWDAYLWVDSPDCFFMKVDNIQGNHDLNSTLRKANGQHRILSTISDADNVIDNRNSTFVKTLSDMCRRDFTKVIFVTSMPMSQLIGTDYDGLIQQVQPNFPDTPLFNIPSRSMTDCWLDGYSDLLFSLAKNIDISWAKSQKNSVAIVWNLFDRNEGDALWNTEELKKIFAWLWLEVVSIWLEWKNYDEVLNIKNAQTIISFPYGRKAAKKIASRLNVWLLELDLPFWLNNTVQFIQTIGTYFQLSEWKIESFIDQQFKQNDIGILKHIVRETFIGKKISYYWDPYLLLWIVDFADTFGFSLEQIFIHGQEKHLNNNKKWMNEALMKNYYYNFDEMDIKDTMDIYIGLRNKCIDIVPQKILEFWFPSYQYHVFTKQPYYGIEGSLHFINRIFNILP